jgi:Zn-dependent oligopeptidase
LLSHSFFFFFLFLPCKVKAFLRSVAQGLKPIAQEEANELLSIKSQLEGPAAAAQGLHQWDLPFYTAIAKVVVPLGMFVEL